MPRIKSIDHLIGTAFGYWTLLEDLGRVYNRRLVKVRCKCGLEKHIDFAEIKRGKSTNCGCQVKNNPLDWIGKKINRLTIIKIISSGGGKTKLKCVCSCGKFKIIRFDSLMNQSTKSCGCYGREIVTKHGMRNHSLFNVWCGMRQRCTDINAPSYKNYGSKGVVVCEEWMNDFKSFYDWAINNGWKKGLQLDKDILASELPGKIYSPSTCCFVTRKRNMNSTTKNVFLEYNGEVLTMTQWSEKLNIPYHLIVGRKNDGWSVEKIFNTPVDKRYSKNK